MTIFFFSSSRYAVFIIASFFVRIFRVTRNHCENTQRIFAKQSKHSIICQRNTSGNSEIAFLVGLRRSLLRPTHLNFFLWTILGFVCTMNQAKFSYQILNKIFSTKMLLFFILGLPFAFIKHFCALNCRHCIAESNLAQISQILLHDMKTPAYIFDLKNILDTNGSRPLGYLDTRAKTI